MKILLINLDRSPERLTRMDALLTGLGLPFERVPAVDGKLLSDAEKKRWLDGDGNFGSLGPSEIGCFLSHRTCWEIAAAGPDSHAVVLEDDVRIGANAMEFLSRTDWIPADSDIVKLETFQPTCVDKTPAARIGGRSVSRLRAKHLGAAAYIVSRAGASKLIAASETFSVPLDHFLFDPRVPTFGALTTYQLVPALCMQDVDYGGSPRAGLGSTLHNDRSRNRRTGTARLRRELARPFEHLGKGLRGMATFVFTSRKRVSVPFE